MLVFTALVLSPMVSAGVYRSPIVSDGLHGVILVSRLFSNLKWSLLGLCWSPIVSAGCQ